MLKDKKEKKEKEKEKEKDKKGKSESKKAIPKSPKAPEEPPRPHKTVVVMDGSPHHKYEKQLLIFFLFAHITMVIEFVDGLTFSEEQSLQMELP